VSAGRILIVEDEPALMRGLQDTFAGKGYEVLCARDGEAGLRLALEAQPELILLDIMLPKVNGYEICRAVREQGLEMPIIMLTARQIS
jgi:DNA-binding response OmpR family regulator